MAFAVVETIVLSLSEEQMDALDSFATDSDFDVTVGLRSHDTFVFAPKDQDNIDWEKWTAFNKALAAKLKA